MAPLLKTLLNEINNLLMLSLAVAFHRNRSAELKMNMPVAADRAQVAKNPTVA